jgi:hypothetical protein
LETTIMATLPDMLRAELARCHPLARSYDAMGSTGAFACALLDEALSEAAHALREGDLACVQKALDRLRSFRDVMPDLTHARVLRTSAWIGNSLRHPGHPATVVARSEAWPFRPSAPAPAQEQFFTWNRAA